MSVTCSLSSSERCARYSSGTSSPPRKQRRHDPLQVDRVPQADRRRGPRTGVRPPGPRRPYVAPAGRLVGDYAPQSKGSAPARRRASSTSGRRRSDHWQMASSRACTEHPSTVSEYSTLGETTGWTPLSTRPFISSCLRVWMSIFWETPPSSLLSSPWRLFPPPLSAITTSGDHHPETASNIRCEAHPGSSTQWTRSLSVLHKVPASVTRR